MLRLARLSLFACCALFLVNNLFGATGGSCPTSAPSGITNCYYADYTNGSDTNNGTTESTPWQHFPGMAGCANNCSSNSPAAGDGYILRGGITWPAAALTWNWSWSGSSTTSTPGCTGSGCIYIGVDPNWYSGSSWTRPILNGGGSSGNTNSSLINIPETGNYIIIDNIEFTGLYWSGSPGYGTAYINLPAGDAGAGEHDTIEHVYIHGWSHAAGASDIPCGINGDTGDISNNAGSIIEYSVISGADTDQASCNGAVFGGPPYIEYNQMEYVSSCMIIDGTVTVHDNTCSNVVHSFNSSAHENALEVNWDGQNVTIYNNVIRHLGSGALGIWCAPDGGVNCSIFDNVMYDTDIGNVLDIAASLKGTTGTVNLWNNTVECGPDSNPSAVCASGISAQATAVTLQNNHFITNAGNYWGTNGPTPTLSNNVLQTLAQANSQGYNSSQTYAFSPTASYPTDATPGRGSSASSLCSASGVSACGSDTTYGVAYNTSNHTVSTPGRPTHTWSNPPDVGAYSNGTGPGVPQNLTGSSVAQ